jgi:hypothetical protein
VELVFCASIPLCPITLNGKIKALSAIREILAAISACLLIGKITCIAFLTGRKTKNSSAKDDKK